MRTLPLLTRLLLLSLLGGAAAADPDRAASDQPPHYYVPTRGRPAQETLSPDVCVYGGTASGVVAAVQLARLGRSVVLLEPAQHLGGMTTGGLSYTDFGNKAAIGGIAREFYRRVGKKYGEEEEWKFEPHVAEEVIDEMVREANVPVRFGQFLKSVKRVGSRIDYITTEAGLSVRAKIYIDATYEGDLMANAGVTYTVGREANNKYHETLNGVQVRNLHQFERHVDPYVIPRDPASGLLPGIEHGPIERPGSGDRRIQAYNFRLCLTTDPANRIPFKKPKGYDERWYELLARYLETGWEEVFNKFDPIRGGKFDVNNHGAVSTDFIGQNYAWPGGSYRVREGIFQNHVRYIEGLFWFLTHDRRVPEHIRRKMETYGLCKDEFADTGGWPHQIYVREARRMVSDYIITEHDCRGRQVATDSVGLGAYGMDSHNCRRFTEDERVLNEGDVQVGGFPPYPISYRALVPRRGECPNLLAPVCVSASHIAYGSLRMEPVFMILGQSSALAADLALTKGIDVQDLPYTELRPALERAGQVLEWRVEKPKQP